MDVCLHTRKADQHFRTHTSALSAATVAVPVVRMSCGKRTCEHAAVYLTVEIRNRVEAKGFSFMAILRHGDKPLKRTVRIAEIRKLF